MSFDGQAMLLGAMYVADCIDSIGVAVFGLPGGNTAYVAEMDAYFRIIGFLDFHNYDGSIIDYNLPELHKLKPYAVGQYSPIPFWIGGICHVMEGDAESNDVLKIFGRNAIHNSVLIDLRQYFSDARFGVFQEQFDRWAVEDITAAYTDVFYEPPIHSRYWVTRLGDAVRHARSMTEPPHPVDDELRRVALEWIERFATKTDFDRLMAVIGHLLGGAISSDRAQAMVFAFLVNKIQTNNFRQIEKRIIESRPFRRLFPEGIYAYLWRNNWPKVSFEYRRPHDLLEPLFREIHKGSARENFIRAERLAYLLFAREDAPRQVIELIAEYVEKYQTRLDKARIQADRILHDRSRSAEWIDAAKFVLYNYHILMALDGIISGELRLSRTTINRRFGMDSYYVNQLEEIVGLSLS